MSDAFDSILPSVLILGAVALVALYLTLTRGWADASGRHIRGAVQIAALTVLLQAAHFAEELLTGFRQRLPALFGQAPMPMQFFVAFNLAWLVIWCLCVWGLAARLRAALFPLWFLGMAALANGFAHPLLSVLARGYFPGLVTAPAVGVAGALLLQRLFRLTVVGGPSPRAVQERDRGQRRPQPASKR